MLAVPFYTFVELTRSPAFEADIGASVCGEMPFCPFLLSLLLVGCKDALPELPELVEGALGETFLREKNPRFSVSGLVVGLTGAASNSS